MIQAYAIGGRVSMPAFRFQSTSRSGGGRCTESLVFLFRGRSYSTSTGLRIGSMSQGRRRFYHTSASRDSVGRVYKSL